MLSLYSSFSNLLQVTIRLSSTQNSYTDFLVPLVLSVCPKMWPYILELPFLVLLLTWSTTGSTLVRQCGLHKTQSTVTGHAVFTWHSKMLQTTHHSFNSLPSSFSASLSLLPTLSTEKNHSDSCQCYQSPGFCYDNHSEQYIQLHRSSIVKHSTMYHGDNLSNSLPKWHLHAWLVARSKRCSCLVQLAGRNTTSTAMRNAVFFERASY
jgi:hypothetical protein